MTNDLVATKAIETIVETVVKSVIDTAKDVGRKAWEEVRWVEAARKYKEQLKDRYSTMRVLGKPKPVVLEGVFTEVYVLDTPTAMRRFNIDELQKRQQEAESTPLSRYESKRIHALRLAIQESKLFILGKPGAGKTTFLKYLALQADKLDKLPIFVSLNEWAESGLDLLQFIEQQFAICQFPSAREFIERLFQQGMALILFDGLDEVNEAADKRLKTSRTIANFSQQYNKSHIIITCRIAATDFSFDKFTYVELADFTDEQAEAFARKWFAESPKIADQFWVELKQTSHRGLLELAHSPLLLTLLCLNYEETLTFPARRVEIYEEAIDALLKKWDSSRGVKRDEIYKSLSLGRKRQLLTYIATDYFQRGQIFFPKNELARKIEEFLSRLSDPTRESFPEGEIIIKAVEAQHGLIVERAKGIFSFSHLTLQEYFTARYISEHSKEKTLDELMVHSRNPRWREVFLLTSSLLMDGDDFFRRFRKHIDSWLFDKPALLEFLEWSSNKAIDYSFSSHPAVMRFVTISLDQDSEIDHALANALGKTIAFDNNPRFGLDLNLTLGVKHLHSNTGYTALEKALNYSHSLGITQLTEIIMRILHLPSLEKPSNQGQIVVAELQASVSKYRNIWHKRNFNEQEKQTLSDYKQATVLFAACLRLAAVSSPEVRKKIENSLLLPPGEWEPWWD